MGTTPSHENDGDDVAGTDSDDDDDIIKIQPNARYRVSKINWTHRISYLFLNRFISDTNLMCVCVFVWLSEIRALESQAEQRAQFCAYKNGDFRIKRIMNKCLLTQWLPTFAKLDSRIKKTHDYKNSWLKLI